MYTIQYSKIYTEKYIIWFTKYLQNIYKIHTQRKIFAMYTSPRGAKKPNYYIQTASLIPSETTTRVESNAAKALQTMHRMILHTP